MKRLIAFVLTAFVATAFAVVSLDAEAAKRKKGNPKYAAYVIDARTGKVLHARHANAKRYPASLTKMMTLYLVFEELKAGRLKKSSRVVMSRNAAKRPPSKLGVRPGRSVSVEQAILSLVTKSANDVSTAIAEKISGSEAAFAKRMTLKARQLGMRNTTFRNANGLTARGQLTTARDMAILGLALREHFPREYRYFKTRNFKYGRRNMRNHNRLLGRVKGVDGIKTGYTRASGYNLVSSVSSGGRKIVAVVMGGRSGRSRNAAMASLIRKYLPRASRRGGKRLVSAWRPSYNKRAVAASQAAQKAISSRVTAAHSVAAPSSASITRVKRQLARLARADAPVPAFRPLPVKTAAEKAIDRVTTASVATADAVKPRGWQVQLSASEKRELAEEVLKRARARNADRLKGMAAYTEQVRRNGKTLYRARFTGFDSARHAEKTCAILVKQKFNCIALRL